VTWKVVNLLGSTISADFHIENGTIVSGWLAYGGGSVMISRLLGLA